MKFLLILASIGCMALAQEQPEVEAARVAHAAYYNYLKAANAVPSTPAPVYRNFPLPEINHFIPQYFPPPAPTPTPPKLRYITEESKVEAQEFGKSNKDYFQERQTQFPTKKQYTGPLASHTLGQNVQDTPEVSYSKQKHLETYAAILRQTSNIVTTPKPQNIYSQNQNLFENYYYNKYNQLKQASSQPRAVYEEPEDEPESDIFEPKHIARPRVQEDPTPKYNHFLPTNFPEAEPEAQEFEQYAEDVELGPTGEVLEVYNARLAHLKAVELTRKVLPPLPKEPPKIVRPSPDVDDVQRKKQLAKIAAIRALKALTN